MIRISESTSDTHILKYSITDSDTLFIQKGGEIMFCPNCGNEIDDDSVFCPNCGCNVNAADTQNQPQDQQQNQPQDQSQTANANSDWQPYNATGVNPSVNTGWQPNQGASNGNGKKSSEIFKSKPFIACIGAAAVVVVIILAVALRKPTINLNKYVDITFSGYDTAGVAKINKDENKLEEALKKRKLNTKYIKSSIGQETYGLESFANNKAARAIIDKYAAEALLEMDVRNSGKLKNGQTAKASFSLGKSDAENIEKLYNIKLKYEDVKKKVSGLKKVETKDVFKDLKVTFKGTEGDAYAKCEYKGKDVDEYSFNIKNNKNLKTGDKITVVLNGEKNKSSFISQYSFLPKTWSKTYTVKSLPKYIAKAADLSDKALETLKNQALDTLKAKIASNSSNLTLADDTNYIGLYILSPKNDEGNEIFAVYTGTLKSNDGSLPDTPAYFPVRFSDVMVNGDDLENLKNGSVYGSFEIEGSGIFSFAYTNGYKDGAEMYKDIITSNLDDYNHEVTGDALLAFGN